MIPTPDLLGLYYPSKELASPGNVLPDRIVGSGSTQLAIVTTSLAQATDYWNGAVGFFCGSSTAALRGVTFHVRKWDKTSNRLAIAVPLPVSPVAGDQFKLFVGGKTASSQEVLAMKVSGKQPEVDTVSGTNITGVTIKKASAMLGEGTLSLAFNATTKALTLRMGTTGDYGPETILTANATGLPVYNKDLAGFILVDVVFASLPVSGSQTDTFTLTTPKGNLIPNFEGFETNDGFGRTRYHLVVAKNKATATLDAMNCFSIWTGKPTGASTTQTSGNTAPSYVTPQTLNVINASTWPTRGFWVRNKTKNDFRYVDYRSGNTLYMKAIDWGVYTFRTGRVAIAPGMMIGNSTSPTITAIVDQVYVASGSWAGGDATGTLILKKYTGSSFFGSTSNLYLGSQIAVTGNGTSTRGFRGLQAQTWQSSDAIEPASDLDLGINLPASGLFLDPPNENTAPEGVTFGHYPSQEECLI
ncbi:MAG: hypothetical protein FWD31_07055, partial [Planctomycetaceae bacterium]|nr:hypothetical protein [Planctomycetaceae bacterium]